MIPFIWHSEKGKTLEKENRSIKHDYCYPPQENTHRINECIYLFRGRITILMVSQVNDGIEHKNEVSGRPELL